MELTDTASYRAFIRKNGSHSTKTVDYRNWNEELIRNANVVLGRDWTSMDEQIKSGFDRYSRDMNDSVEFVLESAARMCFAELRLSSKDIDKFDLGNIAPRAFVHSMRARRITLQQQLATEFCNYRKALG